MKAPMPDESTPATPSLGEAQPRPEDVPLWEETRLLGRTLGSVLRAETGEAGFTRVEAIRQAAVRFRRASPDEAPAIRADLHVLLDVLDVEQTLTVVRAFSYFSLLANIAEDVHQNRRRRAHLVAHEPARPGSVAYALERLWQAQLPAQRIAAFFKRAFVSPVLTAHPTEVQRRSILECQAEVAALLHRRDAVAHTGESLQALDGELEGLVLTLWQTATLRTTRLRVIDEIDNGLSFYHYTFLRELPRLHLDLEDALRARADLGGGFRLPAVLQMGSWIGGDRDGNPYVTADVLSGAIRRQLVKG